MAKLKIALFEPKFLTPRANSSSHLVLLKEQADVLAELADEVMVLVEAGEREVLPEENYKIYPIRGKLTSYSDTFSAKHTSIPYFSDFFSIDLIFKAAKLLKNLKPGVIYSCGSSFAGVYTAILSKLSRVPAVHYIMSHKTDIRKWYRYDIDSMGDYKIPFRYLIQQLVMDAIREIPRRDFILRWGLKQISNIICSSEYIKTDLKNISRNWKDMPVIYPAVSGFNREQIDSSEKGDPVITYFGHLWQGRGVLDLVVAFADVVKQYPQAKLMIASNNIQSLSERYFKELVSKFNLRNNIILKSVVKDIYSDVLLKSTIIALPYRDIPSIKLLEAMAAARPVITTDIGWASEVISNNKNGSLIKKGDVEDLAKRIKMLIDNPVLARQIGQAARHTVSEMCNLTVNTKKILEVLNEAAHANQ